MSDASLIAIRMRLTGGKQVAAEAKAANAEIAATGTAAKKASATSSASMAKLAKTATTLKKTGQSLTRYVTLPVVGVGVAAGAMALDFDRSMRNVNSIAQLPERQFQSLRQQVLDLAGPTAQAPKTLSEGLYDLVSSGFKAKESIGILRASALAASAGLTSTAVSTKAVAAVLNSYQLPASAASKVSDTLFETVNRGVLTFDDLATTIGDVLPFAAQLHVNLNEIGASTATMTKAGLSAPETMTRLKNTLVTLIKPGKELKSRLDEMNTTGQELIKKKGLQGALEAIIAPAHGSKEAIAAMFPNIRALGGVLSLTGRNAGRAAEDLKAFHSTAGATNKVLKEQEKSFGFKLQRAWAKLQVVLIELGEKILPIVVPMLLDLGNAIKTGVEWFSKLPSPVQKVVGGMTGLLAIAGPLLIAVGSLAGAFAALDAAALPWIAAAAGIIALGVGIGILYAKVKLFRTVAPILLAAFFPMAGIALAVVQHLGWVTNAFNNVVNFFKKLPGRVAAGLRALPGVVGRLVGRAIVFFATLPFRIPVLITQMGIRLVHALIGIAPSAARAAAKIATSIAQGIASKASAVWGWVKTLPGKFASAVGSIASGLFNIGKEIATNIAKGIHQGIKEIPLLGKALELGEGALGGAKEGLEAINPFAGGTLSAPGGLALVGEMGPEIVRLPRGAEVVPALPTREMLTRPIPGPRSRPPLEPVRQSATAASVRASSGGGNRPLYATIHVGRRQIAEVVTEAKEDAEARL